MELKNDAQRICEGLALLRNVGTITRGWPEGFSSLPCIAVAEASNKPVDYRDGTEYCAELEYWVRLFGKDARALDELATQADGCMQALGYQRVFVHEEQDAEIRQRAMRYRGYLI